MCVCVCVCVCVTRVVGLKEGSSHKCDFMEITFIEIYFISGQIEDSKRSKGKSRKAVILVWSQGNVRSCTNSISAS